MLLSYSTLNAVRDCERFWLCKMMDLPAIEFDYFTAGKEAHKIIQAHVSQKKEDKRLFKAGILMPRWHFPIVEEKDFDEQCGFQFQLKGDYYVRGFLDGLNPDTKTFLEIKTGSGWNIMKFKNSIQRKIYALGMPEYTEALLLTCTKDLEDVKKYALPLTKKDREDATDWINEGIKIIEKGKFDGGENINCARCIYQQSCTWRQNARN